MSSAEDPLDKYFEFLKPLAAEGLASLEAHMTQFVARQLLTSDEAMQLIARLQGSLAPQALASDALSSPLDAPKGESDSAVDSTVDSADALPPPEVTADWGQQPAIGHRVCPVFTIRCPAYRARPLVHVQLDRKLDCDDELSHDSWPTLESREQGLYEFSLPFSLTTKGSDCRPGQYQIDVRIAFVETSRNQPAFFRGRMRLTVRDPNVSHGPTLEISSDDQSLINMQGQDLTAFGRVVVRGQGGGLVNVHNASNPLAAPAASPASAAFVMAMPLWPDQEQHERRPSLPVELINEGAGLEAALLVFPDGRRVGVLARDHVSFGRNRRPEPNESTADTNDVCLRFLPKSDAHSKLSNGISRRHFELYCQRAGIELINRSSGGIAWNGQPIPQSLLVPHPVFEYSGFREEHQLDVKLRLVPPSDKQLELGVTLFGRPLSPVDARMQWLWDEIYARQMGGELCRLWQLGLSTGLDAIRVDRLNNGTQESYLMLVREAEIGGHQQPLAIDPYRGTIPPVARLLHRAGRLWLETRADQTVIDGSSYPARTLVPLRHGLCCEWQGRMVNVAPWRHPEELP